MTDNGSGYRSIVHAIACRALGIRHLRTRPYRPRTNGKAERFIRTMLGGWAYGAIYRTQPNAPPPSPACKTPGHAARSTGAACLVLTRSPRRLRRRAADARAPARQCTAGRYSAGRAARRAPSPGRAVGVDDQVDVAVVHRLQRGAGVDVDDAARRHVLPLGRIADVHRQRALQDDERLGLDRVAVAAAPGAGLVAPHVAAHHGEAGQVAQLGDVARGLAGLVRRVVYENWSGRTTWNPIAGA